LVLYNIQSIKKTAYKNSANNSIKIESQLKRGINEINDNIHINQGNTFIKFNEKINIDNNSVITLIIYAEFFNDADNIDKLNFPIYNVVK
jgi:acetyltransferase-like isoleucine patch superfamily enzyme